MAETDFRDVAGLLASSFNQMRLRPDTGLDARLQTIAQQRTANRAKNKTVEYLRGLNTPMGNQLAGMVETGGITGQQAYAQILELQKEERAAGKDTALIRNAIAAGFTPGTQEFQTFIASGGDIYSQETALLSSLPKPDKGMRYEFDRGEGGQITDIKMVPISGSEAAIEEEERQRALSEKGALETQKRTGISRSVNQILTAIENDTSLFGTTGVYGKFAADYLPSTPARNVKNLLKSVQSNVAFNRLQEMREASKTGGALGNVSNVELGLLMAAHGAIQQDLSKDLLVENLKEIDRIMGMVEQDPIAMAYYSEGKDLRGTKLDKQVKARGKGGSGSSLSNEDLLKKYGG
tara:strand:+ start:1383 stop:2432 length:1050 start_codon:yes stop_codon:yes gene_type:complete